MSADRIDVTRGQWQLFLVWLGGFVLALVLLLVQTMGPQAPLPADFAWQWFLPLVLPTLSLMLGTLVFNDRNNSPKRTVGRPILNACLALSVLYLALLNALLVVWPFLRLRPDEIKEMLGKSQLWLPALQTILGIALGAFFVAKQED